MKLHHLHEKVISPQNELDYVKLLINKVRPLLVDKDKSHRETMDILDYVFRPFGIVFEYSPRFSTKFSSSNSAHNVCLDGGSFDTFLRFITINILDGLEDVLNDAYKFSEWAQEFVGVTKHELVHRLQAEKSKVDFRGTDIDNMRVYLSDKQEIMAYAAQAAHELLSTTGDSPESLIQQLSNRSTLTKILPLSSALGIYRDEFEIDDEVWRRFIKQLTEYLKGDA